MTFMENVPGLQLWSVKDELARDEQATLQTIAALGYREIELFTLPKAPAVFKTRCADLGLAIVSGHFYMNSLRSQKTVEIIRELGLRYAVIVFPTLRALSETDMSRMTLRELTPLYEHITLDDYLWNAEHMNRLGENLKRQGLQLGYHNHAVDLKGAGNVVFLETLIESTDADWVAFELDCGHVVHAGKDPIDLIKRYPTRIPLLHLKDLKPGYRISTSLDAEEENTDAVLGAGVIDWKSVFEAAREGCVRHCFVEHEGVMDCPPLEAIARSSRYLRRLGP